MSVATANPVPAAMSPAGQQAPRAPLRRATYVHVSDLTSAYNIDHGKLEQELARARIGEESSPTRTDEEVSSDFSPEEGGTDGEASIASHHHYHSSKRLQAPRGGYNLCVLVGEVKVVVDKLRVDRSRVRLAEVVVGDETGCVSLRARDDQIEVLREVSEQSGAVVLRNCTLELYKGKHIRLAVTKWGKLSTYPDEVASTPPPPSKMNADRNFSQIDLSLVASEMVDTENMGANERDMGSDSSRGGSAGRGNSGRYQQYHQGGYGRNRRQQPNQHQQRQYNQPPYGHQGHHMGQPGYQQMPYPYGPPPHQHGRQEGASQHLLLRQHYELQQRQLQQMQAYQEQQEQRRPLGPPIQNAASFDTAGDYSVASPMGAGPMFVPVSMTAGARSATSPMLSPGPSLHEHYGGAMTPSYGQADSSRGSEGQAGGASLHGGLAYQTNLAQGAREGHFFADEPDRSANESWSAQLSPSGPHVMSPRSDSPVSISPGHMNPTAQAFDPSYMSQQQGYAYMSYNPAQASAPVYASLPRYNQNVMYVPATRPSEYPPPNVQDTSEASQGPQIPKEDDTDNRNSA